MPSLYQDDNGARLALRASSEELVSDRLIKNVCAMGSPKLFDRDEVLDRALDVFWEVGYPDASAFSEFGDKQGLYVQGNW